MKLEHHGAEDLEADGHLRAVQARRESEAMREPPLLEASRTHNARNIRPEW